MNTARPCIRFSWGKLEFFSSEVPSDNSENFHVTSIVGQVFTKELYFPQMLSNSLSNWFPKHDLLFCICGGAVPGLVIVVNFCNFTKSGLPPQCLHLNWLNFLDGRHFHYRGFWYKFNCQKFWCKFNYQNFLIRIFIIRNFDTNFHYWECWYKFSLSGMLISIFIILNFDTNVLFLEFWYKCPFSWIW